MIFKNYSIAVNGFIICLTNTDVQLERSLYDLFIAGSNF